MINLNKVLFGFLFLLLLEPFINYLLYPNPYVEGVGSLVGLLGIGIFLLLFIDKKNLRIPRYWVFLLLYVLYTLVLNAIKLDELTLPPLYRYRPFYFGFFLLFIENTSLHPKQYRILLRTIPFVLLVAFLVIMVQEVYSYQFFVKPGTYENLERFSYIQIRPESIFSWTNSMGKGLTFVPLLALLLPVFFLKVEKKKIIFWSMIGLIFVFVSRGRWVMLNMLFVLGFLFYQYKQVRFKRSATTLLLFPVVIVASIYLMDLFGIDYMGIIQNRILDQERGGLVEGSAGSRLLAFEVFFELFPNNPIFGAGAGITELLSERLAGESSQIHVGYLSSFYYYGIVGGMLYMLFLFYLSKDMYRTAQLIGQWGPFSGWMCLILANLTLNYLLVNNIGIILVMAFHKYYKDQYVLQIQAKQMSEVKNVTQSSCIG